MIDDATERSRLTRLVHDAVARGQAALGVGDRDEAILWLERAHRLAPADGTVTLFLASALIGDDNPRAADLFARAVEAHDVRDAWLGLATTRLLMGDLAAVRTALAQVLSRHALWPDIVDVAQGVARATGAPGWCGLTSEGMLVVHPVEVGEIDIRIEGKVSARRDMSSPSYRRRDPTSQHRHGTARPGHLDRHGLAGDGPASPSHDHTPPETRLPLPLSWPLTHSITVLAKENGPGDNHLSGAPSPQMSSVASRVLSKQPRAVSAAGPGAPTTPIPIRACPLELAARDGTSSPPNRSNAFRASHLSPVPRSFAIRWAELPETAAKLRLRGRDRRDLQGSPVIGRRADWHDVSRPKDQGRPTPSPTPTVHPPRQWRDKGAGAVILVTHHDGGGVERRVQTSVAAHVSQGLRAIVLRPLKLPDGVAGAVVEAAGLPAWRFELPRQQPALLRFLRQTKPIAAELHHFLNHDPSVFQIIRALGIPYDAHTHDYAWFCPRIALVGRGGRYCGEPESAACEACVAETGSFLHEDIRVAALLERSRHILSGARRVIAPSRDAAARMERHFPGLPPTVIPHEDDDALDEPPPIPLVTGTVRVCLAGAIGLHKGFHVLLACARDARKRALDLTFVVAGTTIDDQRLIDTGRVFVTGPYKPDEAADLIRAQKAALALFPSIWPETWCLGLTELWRAGLRVAAFDIGAPAERIRRTGRGFLLPLGLSPPRINDALLNAARGRSFLPIRRSSAYKPSH